MVIFTLTAFYKVTKLSSMPLHLRWELYPVGHAPRDKRSYGGSYLEEMDWAKKPRHRSLTGELLEMMSEILFLRKLKEHNPYKIWLFSLSMHWGIYLLLTWVFLLVAEAVFNVDVISPVTNFLGIMAFITGSAGSFMLIFKRATNSGLKLYTAPVDYFNLMFLFSIFVTGLVSLLTDHSFSSSRIYIEGVLSFRYTPVTFITVLNFGLLELFFIYMPFTKLFHYIAKYFTYHKVLWDNSFKVKGSPDDKKIIKQLSEKVTWAAPHIVQGKTWLEEAEIIDGSENKK